MRHRSERFRRPEKVALFATLAAAVGVFSFLQSMIVPVLGPIAIELESDQGTTSWVLTAYLLSATVCTPILGRVGDAYGRRRVLVVALSALVLGSLIAVAADSIGWLILARVVQGAGGGVIPLSLGVVRAEFDTNQASVMAAISSFTALGFGLGLVVAGPLLSTGGFAWLFLAPAIGTLLVLGLTLRYVPRGQQGPRTPISILPAVVLCIGLVSTLLTVSRGPHWGWSSSIFIGGMVVGLGSLVLWALVELRITNPFIDLRLMASRPVLAGNGVSLLAGFCVFSAFGFVPQFLQTDPIHGYGFGISVTESGLILVPFTAMSFMAGMTVGRFARRRGFRPLILTGALISASAFLLMVVWHDRLWQFAVFTGMQGYGSGLLISGTSTLVVLSVPPMSGATASGVTANLRTIGGAIGSATTAAILSSSARPDGLASASGYTAAFTLFCCAMAIAAVTAIAIPRRQPQPDSLENSYDGAAGLPVVSAGNPSPTPRSAL